MAKRGSATQAEKASSKASSIRLGIEVSNPAPSSTSLSLPIAVYPSPSLGPILIRSSYISMRLWLKKHGPGLCSRRHLENGSTGGPHH
jgi:hypothetical protein